MNIDQVEWQPLLTCASDTKASAVRKLLDQNKTDAILLLDGGLVIGCLDRTDLNRPDLGAGTAADNQPIGTFAHACTFHAAPDMDAGLVLDKMRRRRLPIIPVKQNGKIIGMISQTAIASSYAHTQ